ncbi:MAG: TolC family protein [Gemmatimonadetes bacterium]|nr:TolC family protein [Gemmatimonadota bacterium]
MSPCLRAALVGTLLCLGPSAAGLGAQQEPLDALVAEGLARNPDLRRAEHQLAQADAAVREATGRWLPALTLTARYSERSGNILDIGEMVNPAFRALNQLLGQDAFPTDVSLKQPFKQETGLRLTQPLFQPAVAAGVGMAREGRAAEAAGLVGERRALAARIRLAYLDYARAVRVEELFTATLGLLTENLRVHTALLAQGVITPDALLRARADHSEGLQRQADAANLRTSAREAFNLLLDRPAAAPLELLPDSLLGITTGMGQDSAVAAALRGRTELRQLDHGIAAAAGAERYASAAFLPSLVAAVDWGHPGRSVPLPRQPGLPGRIAGAAVEPLQRRPGPGPAPAGAGAARCAGRGPPVGRRAGGAGDPGRVAGGGGGAAQRVHGRRPAGQRRAQLRTGGAEVPGGGGRAGGADRCPHRLHRRGAQPDPHPL